MAWKVEVKTFSFPPIPLSRNLGPFPDTGPKHPNMLRPNEGTRPPQREMCWDQASWRNHLNNIDAWQGHQHLKKPGRDRLPPLLRLGWPQEYVCNSFQILVYTLIRETCNLQPEGVELPCMLCTKFYKMLKSPTVYQSH